MESHQLCRNFLCKITRKSSPIGVRSFVSTATRSKIPEKTTSAVSLTYEFHILIVQHYLGMLKWALC